MGVLSKGQGESPGRQGRLLVVKSHQELIFVCDFAGCYLRHALAEEAGIILRSLQAKQNGLQGSKSME